MKGGIPDNDVEENHSRYDAGFNVILDTKREYHDNYEHEGQAIRDLPEEDLPGRRALCGLDLVGPVPLEAGRGLYRRQSIGEVGVEGDGEVRGADGVRDW
jgi:hypothetical protein